MARSRRHRTRLERDVNGCWPLLATPFEPCALGASFPGLRWSIRALPMRDERAKFADRIGVKR